MEGTTNTERNTMNDTITPEIGMGATICYYTDRKAVTIIAVNESGRKVTVQFDKATRIDDNGMSESQSYEYEANTDAPIREFSLRKNGRWIPVGQDMKSYGNTLSIGRRAEYYDYSF